MKKYTLEDIIKDIEFVKANKLDSEAAHSVEDSIMKSFILGVTEDYYTIEEIKKIADEILKCNQIKFPRWCS